MGTATVDPRARWRPATLRDPLPYGYVHIAAAVEPPRRPGPPFPRRSARRAALLGRLEELAAELRRHDAVLRATVYRAVLMPPPDDAAPPPAQFDVAVLVETTSPETVAAIQATEPYRRLIEAVNGAARDVHVMAARCARLVGDVDKSRPGLFLFNHFAARDADVALELWDRLAGWYEAKTGLDNSTLLRPVGDADYAFVNHARWDRSLPRLMLDQFAKPSFWTYVRGGLRANRTVAMPILYRLA